MEEITKKNLVKISALYALRLRKLAGHEWTEAGELAELAGLNRRSLYVLLSRWRRWGLVRCNMFTTPRQYAIGSNGSHYLGKLDRWYGNRDIVFEMVTDNAKVSFWWQSIDRWTSQPVKLNFIRYPFREASDYSVVRPDVQGRFVYQGESMIRIRKPDALQAVYGIRDDLGLTWGDGLINKLIELQFIGRN